MGLWRNHPTFRGLAYALLALAPLGGWMGYSSMPEPTPPGLVDFTIETVCGSNGLAWHLTISIIVLLQLLMSGFLIAFPRGFRFNGLFLFALALAPWAMGILGNWFDTLHVLEMVSKSGSGSEATAAAGMSEAHLIRGLGAGASAGLLMALAAAAVGERLAAGRPFLRDAGLPGQWPLLVVTLTASACAAIAATAALTTGLFLTFAEELSRQGEWSEGVMARRQAFEAVRLAGPWVAVAVLVVTALLIWRLLAGSARTLGLAIWLLILPLMLADLGTSAFLTDIQELVDSAWARHFSKSTERTD